MSKTGATIQLVSRSSKNGAAVLCSPQNLCSPQIEGFFSSSSPNAPPRKADDDEARLPSNQP